MTALAPSITMLPIESVYPSPLNPRKTFDDARTQELAESIRAHGIQQPLVVRKTELTYDLISGERDSIVRTLEFLHEIIMGERRYRAAILAGLATVPCIIREGITDAQLLELALHENIQRADLNPIEEALAFEQLTRIGGMKQADLAAKIGRSQENISNRMRLLKLPQDVQDLIAQGQLTGAHGVALAKYADFPKLASILAEAAVKFSVPTRQLEGEFGDVIDIIRGNDYQDTFRSLGNQTPFKWESTCKGNCPFNAFRKSNYIYGGGYCLRPEHYEQLVSEAKAAEEAAMQKALEKAAKAAAKASAAIPAKPGEEPKPAPTVVNLKNLVYGTYKDLKYEKLPPGCDANCECRVAAIDRWGAETVVCLKPGHYQALCNAVTREEGKKRKAAFALIRQEAETLLAAESDSVLRHVAAVMFESVLRASRPDALKLVSEEVEDKDIAAHIANGRYGGTGKRKQLAKLPLPKILALAGRLIIRNEIRAHLEFKKDELPDAQFLLSAPKTPAVGESLATADRIAIAQEELLDARLQLADRDAEIERLKRQLTAEKSSRAESAEGGEGRPGVLLLYQRGDVFRSITGLKWEYIEPSPDGNGHILKSLQGTGKKRFGDGTLAEMKRVQVSPAEPAGDEAVPA